MDGHFARPVNEPTRQDMHNRYKVISGSRLGAIAIHVTFVACGAGHQASGAMQHGLDT
jgi:hypothetical protein